MKLIDGRPQWNFRALIACGGDGGGDGGDGPGMGGSGSGSGMGGEGSGSGAVGPGSGGMGGMGGSTTDVGTSGFGGNPDGTAIGTGMSAPGTAAMAFEPFAPPVVAPPPVAPVAFAPPAPPVGALQQIALANANMPAVKGMNASNAMTNPALTVQGFGIPGTAPLGNAGMAAFGSPGFGAFGAGLGMMNAMHNANTALQQQAAPQSAISFGTGPTAGMTGASSVGPASGFGTPSFSAPTNTSAGNFSTTASPMGMGFGDMSDGPIGFNDSGYGFDDVYGYEDQGFSAPGIAGQESLNMALGQGSAGGVAPAAPADPGIFSAVLSLLGLNGGVPGAGIPGIQAVTQPEIAAPPPFMAVTPESIAAAKAAEEANLQLALTNAPLGPAATPFGAALAALSKTIDFSPEDAHGPLSALSFSAPQVASTPAAPAAPAPAGPAPTEIGLGLQNHSPPPGKPTDLYASLPAYVNAPLPPGKPTDLYASLPAYANVPLPPNISSLRGDPFAGHPLPPAVPEDIALSQFNGMGGAGLYGANFAQIAQNPAEIQQALQTNNLQIGAQQAFSPNMLSTVFGLLGGPIAGMAAKGLATYGTPMTDAWGDNAVGGDDSYGYVQSNVDFDRMPEPAPSAPASAVATTPGALSAFRRRYLGAGDDLLRYGMLPRGEREYYDEDEEPVRMAEGGRVEGRGGALSAIFRAARDMLSPGGDLNPTPAPFEPSMQGVMDAGNFAAEMVNPAPGIDAAIEHARRGEYGNALVEGAMSMPMLGAGRSIRAYHGSPHDFDRFDLSKIGTGEGAQAYGHGLYFAENESVARSYRDTLAPKFRADNKLDARISNNAAYAEDLQRQLSQIDPASPEAAKLAKRIEFFEQSNRKLNDSINGRMYEVDINADPSQFLDFNAPLGSQSEAVQDLLGKYGYPEQPIQNTMTNFDLSRGDARMTGFSDTLSSALKESGIPGIKFLDQGSRGVGGGSRNYVVFDDSLITILRKYGVGSLAALPAGVLATIGISRDQAEEMDANRAY